MAEASEMHEALGAETVFWQVKGIACTQMPPLRSPLEEGKGERMTAMAL
jgi:hypothetical protein